MSQKIAFITGGNRGLGFQTALDLGKQHGIKVVIGSRDLDQGRQAASHRVSPGRSSPHAGPSARVIAIAVPQGLQR